MSFLRSDVFHIPFEFRNLPEAEVVRQAESEFKAAAEREGKAMAASGQKFHVVTNDYQRAQRNLKRAEDAFDTAAGLPIPAPPTPKVIDEVSRFSLLRSEKKF